MEGAPERLPGLPVSVGCVGAWLTVSITGVNGRYSGKSVMHYLRINTVETERPAGAGGASIDCDRLEETCASLLSVRGFSHCPCTSTSTTPPLESPPSAILQSSSAQVACGNPMAGPAAVAIDHSSAVPEKQKHAAEATCTGEGRGRAELRRVPQLSEGWKNPVRLYLGTVRVLFKLKHLSRRGRRKVMRKTF